MLTGKSHPERCHGVKLLRVSPPDVTCVDFEGCVEKKNCPCGSRFRTSVSSVFFYELYFTSDTKIKINNKTTF